MRRNLKAIDDARGGGAALPTAVKYLRREVAPLLRGRFTDPIGRALFSATADFTLGVGWMAYDAGRHGLAQRYMTQALRMSHAANDRAFGGRVLAAMSHQALHLGDVRTGSTSHPRHGQVPRVRLPPLSARCWPPWRHAPTPVMATPGGA